MISKSLKNLHLLKKDTLFKRNHVLNKIYNKNIYLIKLKHLDKLKQLKEGKNELLNNPKDSDFYDDFFDENFKLSGISKIMLDCLVYFYKKYNFFVFNDIKSILFTLSACGNLEDFSVLYEIFNEGYKKYNKEKILKHLYLVSILYDNPYVFNFLDNKEKEIIKKVNEEINKSSFILAMEYRSIKIVNHFIEKNIDIINEKNNFEKKTPFILAAEKGFAEIVKLLIEKGAILDAIDDKEKRTSLIWATIGGHTEVVKIITNKIIEKRKEIREKDIKEYNDKYLNVKDIYEKNALFYAIEGGYTEIVKILINSGANVNEKGRYKETALILAAEKGHTEIVKLLIENGADINESDKFGWTALIKAANYNHKKIVKLLIENGADINKEKEDGETALDFAMQNGHEEVVKFLIENGADLDKRNYFYYFNILDPKYKRLIIKNKKNWDENDMHAALIWSIENNYIEGVKILIKKGANVNKKIYRSFPIILAAEKGRTEIVKLLIENGANVNVKTDLETDYGRTALMLAASWGYKEIVELLLKKGARVDEQDNVGRTAIDYANNRREIRKILLKALEEQKQKQQ